MASIHREERSEIAERERDRTNDSLLFIESGKLINYTVPSPQPGILAPFSTVLPAQHCL